MNQTLNLFDQPENETPWVAPVISPRSSAFEVPTLDHPYARYGLAVALWKNNWPATGGDEARFRVALIEAIESGLEQFRMKTPDDPQGVERKLVFHPVSAADLRADLNQVQSQGLAEKGIYLFPTVLTTDGGARATWQEAEVAIVRLRVGELLSATDKLKRSFAPTTAKINNGTSSQTEPKGTLLEIACCCITTLSPHKPAAWPGQDRGNTILIPDIPLEPLRDFVELFEQMRLSKLDGDLWTAKLKPLDIPASPSAPQNSKRAPKPAAAPKAGFKRPRLHNGNFPFAPQNPEVFGAVGLLAAIGRWALESEDVNQIWAREVLSLVANAPLYVTSYAGISQLCFGHHIVSLAMEGRLSHILAAFYDGARLYADDEGHFVNRLVPFPGSTKADYSRDYFRLYLHFSRFLQQFSRPAFADFLSHRAEYPALCRSLLDGFFAHIMIPPSIVESARILGQHLNRTAYFVAKEEYASERGTDEDKVRKAKAKILVEFESAILSAKTSVDMLHRISTRSGRLLNGDLPSGADIFMDACASGESLSLADAQHLLIAYLRLRSPQQERAQKPLAPELTDALVQNPAEPSEPAMDDSQ